MAVSNDYYSKPFDTLTPDELAIRLADPIWRICSGQLYKIIIKGDTEDDDLVLPFKPNRAQRRLIARLWHRNIILKARQLGFTTLIAIMWLDHALFNDNVRCGIVAQNKDVASEILRDKVLFAYDNLPEVIRLGRRIIIQNSKELMFENNSSVRVATSYRGGTPHRLHISEYGKICKAFPLKAREVKTGSIPAVPKSGILVIESTAEGMEGDFYEKTQAAIKIHESGRKLNQRDYRFHFYAWWMAPEYRLPAGSVSITQKDHMYFDQVEAEMSTMIDIEQRSWYVATRDSDFAGSEEDMWQEYPSTPQEAFKQSTDGNYYAKQMTEVRKGGRILRIPYLPHVLVDTFWDVGNSDGTAIWFLQRVGMDYRMVKYLEGHGEDLRFWAKELADTGYLFGRHYLPHDADHKRLSLDNKSIKEILESLGVKNIEIVPVIDNIQAGIQLTRAVFADTYFDEEGCKLGISRLDNYKKSWNQRQGRWSDTPFKDINTEGADAFRQYAQARSNGMLRTYNSDTTALKVKRRATHRTV